MQERQPIAPTGETAALNASTLLALDSFLSLFGEAVLAFGDPEKAKSWFVTPVAAFGDRMPVAVLSEDGGEQRVRSTLRRIEHGIF